MKRWSWWFSAGCAWAVCGPAAWVWAELPAQPALQTSPAVPREPLTWQAAVRETLQNSRQISLSAQRALVSQGQLDVARSAFDPSVQLGLAQSRDLNPLNDLSRASLGRSELETERLTLSASLLRQSRSGLTTKVFTEWQHLRDQSSLNFTSPGAGYGSIGFSVDIPLGRGRGQEEVGAGERIADLGLSAARLDAAHQAGLTVSEVLQRYWAVRAHERYQALAREIELRSVQQVEQIKKLIAKEQVPASEINLVQANRADKARQRALAEQALREARTALGKTLGRDPAGMAALGATASEFPAANGLEAQGAQIFPATQQALQDIARQRRLDLQAQQLRRDSAQQALRQSELRTRPDVQLQLSLQYRGLADSIARADLLRLNQNVAGPSVAAKLNYRWPVGSRQAQGELLQSQALLDQQSLSLQELNHTIGADVGDAWNAMKTGAELVRSADQSVEFYEAAVNAERRRYAMGMVTLSSVLQTEDRLDAALQQRILQRQTYASALIRLWTQSGQLIEPAPGEPGAYRVSIERWLNTTSP